MEEEKNTSNKAEVSQKITSQSSEEPSSSPENSRLLGVGAYLVFFLPYIINKDDSFAIFHANQGFVLFLLVLAFNVVGMVIPFFGWILILPLGYLFCLVLLVIGVMNAWNGKKERLPFIGQFDLLK